MFLRKSVKIYQYTWRHILKTCDFVFFVFFRIFCVYTYIYIMWEIKKCYLRVNEQRNIQHEIRKQKINWIGHILLINCLLKQIIVGKIKGEIEVTRRRGRRRKKLLDELKDRRGYCHLKEEALDRTMWRNHFGRGIGTFVRQITEWMNIYVYIFFFRA